MVVIAANVGIVLLAHLVERPFPQVIDEGQHIGLAAQGQRVFLADAAGLLAVLAGVLEGVLQAPVHLEPGVDRGLDGRLRCGVPLRVKPPAPQYRSPEFSRTTQ